jgi:hypothetical protein
MQAFARLLMTFVALFTSLILTASVWAQSITADPTTVAAPAGSTGSTTISWGTGVPGPTTVTVSMNGGTEAVVAQTLNGGTSLASWIQPGNSYVFRLYGCTLDWEGFPVCDGSYIASVTVYGVFAPPVSASITQSVPTTEAGTAYTINWSSTNATSCAVEYRRMAVDAGFVFFSSLVNGSLSPSPIVLGEHIWRITCQGAGGPAVSSFSHQVVALPLAQSITFGALSAQTLGALPVTLTASASSGLPITYTSNSPNVCTVSGTSVTLVATGMFDNSIASG